MSLSNTATPVYYGKFRDAVLRGEIPVCKELGIEIKYNVGFGISGRQKPNSSSWILKNWENK